jgi:hypothetical protein
VTATPTRTRTLRWWWAQNAEHEEARRGAHKPVKLQLMTESAPIVTTKPRATHKRPFRRSSGNTWSRKWHSMAGVAAQLALPRCHEPLLTALVRNKSPLCAIRQGSAVSQAFFFLKSAPVCSQCPHQTGRTLCEVVLCGPYCPRSCRRDGRPWRCVA